MLSILCSLNLNSDHLKTSQMYLKCVSTSTGVKGRLIKEHWRRDDRLFFLSPRTSNLNGSSDEFSQILSVILYVVHLAIFSLNPTNSPALPPLSLFMFSFGSRRNQHCCKVCTYEKPQTWALQVVTIGSEYVIIRVRDVKATFMLTI